MPTFQQAEARFIGLVGVPLGALVAPGVLAEMRRDKGGSGRAIERLLGVSPSSNLLDFDDGELKTFHSDRDGFPLETVAVTRVQRVDPILGGRPFAATRLYKKLRRVLFVGVFRPDKDPGTWVVSAAFRFEGRAGTEWYERLERSYHDVTGQLRHRLIAGEDFATLSGSLLQMRVRDSRPYTPVYSERLGRQISNKGIGFYLRREMIAECVEEARACR